MRRPEQTLWVVGTDGIDDVFAKLKHGPLAVDTETTGINFLTERVGALCFAAGTTATFFTGNALARAARWLADQVKKERPLVFHNGKFDMHHMRETFGLHIPYPVFDTTIESHLLDNRGVGNAFAANHHLKDLAFHFVDPDAKDAQKDLLKAIKEVAGTKAHLGDWLVVENDLPAVYGARDPWYTLQLHLQFIERIRYFTQPEEHLPPLMSLYETERWLLLALRDMEERGFRVSRKFLTKWATQLEEEREVARRKLLKIAGREINWNSTPQLRALLFNKKRDGGLGIPVPDRRTKTGAVATDKNVLAALAHPIGAALLQYRQKDKQLGTFAYGLLRASEVDGAVHTDFRQNVDTGRMSSREPNLQQEDKKSGVRHAFRPRKGFVLRMADYSQVEMRLAAHFANAAQLIHGFNHDPKFDTHTTTAEMMFGVKPDEDQRGYGKTQNFATLYGAGINKTAEGFMLRMSFRDAVKSCRKLGYRVGIGESPFIALAVLLRERYDQAMPEMRKAARDSAKFAEQWGMITMYDGRHRWLDEDASYTAFNSRIQGSAAGIAKRGLVNVYRECQLNRGELFLLCQVHDEIIYESEGDPRTDRRVLECLQDTSTFQVPIIADMSGSSISWQKKEKIDLTKKRAA